MRSLRRVSSLVISAVVLTIFMAPSLVNAQDGTPAVACDATFGSDAATVFTNVSKAMAAGSLQASDYAQMGIDISKIRQEYEDMTAPAGCETARQQIAQVSAFDEDIVLLNLFTKLDSKNTAYADFVTSTFNPRFATFKASLTATAAADAGAASSAGASSVCADADFQKQVPDDFKSMASPDMTSAASLGTAALALLKLRYKYEDATAPAGCELAKKDTVLLFAGTEDIVLAAAAGLADTANTATYTDYLTKVVNPRGQKLFTTLKTDLGVASATPAATDAS